MGSVCSRDFSTTLKSKVSRSFFDASPLRCDPNRGQRRQQFAAALPRCDPMRGQRGKQRFNETGKEINRDSVVGWDDATCSSSTVAPACALKVTRHTSYSSPEVAGAGVGRTSSGKSSSSSACSSPVPGRGASLRLPGSVLSGASSPGAAGRGVALRPLVLRRNLSGGSMMPRSGRGLMLSRAVPCWLRQARPVSVVRVLRICLLHARLRRNVSILSTLWSSCHLHRTHTTCMGT